MDTNAISNTEQTQTTPLDEFKEFLAELWEMIKTDFRNSFNFISSNRSFFTTAALLAILLQVSSVSSLGASFEKYCGTKKNSGSSMRGGGNGEPKVLTLQDLQSAKAQEKADKKQEKVDEKRQSKIQKASKKIMKKEPGKSLEEATAEATEKTKAKEDAESLKQGKQAAIGEYKAKRADARYQDKLLKANQERISFFEGIKNKFNSTLSPGALGGPLFGNFDLIFDSVSHIFYIIGIILVVAGVLSLPVLVFLIITYYVFKTMISKFLIL